MSGGGPARRGEGPGLYVALVHHPVRDRAGRVVTTAITNLDVHDLARSCRAYGVRRFFVVSPVTSQRRIVQAIVAHWSEGGAGARRLPERSEALARCEPAESVEAAAARVAELEGGPAPRWVATSARPTPGVAPVGFGTLGERLRSGAGGPHLLLFGTGHGLHPELLVRCAEQLEPIVPPAGYPHLSVRAAAAIVLDRLLGRAVSEEP